MMIADDAKDDRVVGITQSCRSFRDHIEHRLDIRRRAGDDTEDLARRCLLFKRFCQFTRAVFDLVLQVGVGFLKLRWSSC